MASDLLGSIELMSKLGERGCDEVRRDRVSALAKVVNAHGEEEVKNTGDGTPPTASIVPLGVVRSNPQWMSHGTVRGDEKTQQLLYENGVGAPSKFFADWDLDYLRTNRWLASASTPTLRIVN